MATTVNVNLSSASAAILIFLIKSLQYYIKRTPDETLLKIVVNYLKFLIII
jgi:hypothetical protein